jgi:F420-non-reducing hydrogenase iron-sulfur subunit
MISCTPKSKMHLQIRMKAGEIIMTSTEFEPKIIAFLCNWCTYGAADLAGVSRMQYPANTRAIRVMCSATVSPHHILRAFQDGADGVLVGG